MQEPVFMCFRLSSKNFKCFVIMKPPRNHGKNLEWEVNLSLCRVRLVCAEHVRLNEKKRRVSKIRVNINQHSICGSTMAVKKTRINN